MTRGLTCALCVIVSGAVLVSIWGCSAQTPEESRDRTTGDITIFHAGSLSLPFKDVSAAFNRKYPDVQVKAEARGTRDCARQISDLGRSCDVFGAADYKVVENLLMPDHADFNIRFATNELAIVYTEKSKLHDEIDADNWRRILLRRDIAFGRSDPNRDPCGYRTCMLFQLAERHYKQPGLAAQLADKDGDRYVRPKETDLLALLESGEIDYLFVYRSVGEQHGLKILRLPDQINLGSPEFEDFYNTAAVKVTGKKPGEFVERLGSAIVYSVTIPRNVKNREMAEAWVSLLLSPAGQEIVENNGQSVIAPAKVDHLDALPKAFRRYCEQEQ